ncbi:MAG: response regulator [Devosia sp.]
MTCRIMVVEDEIFVATEIEHVIEEMGFTPVGIASEKRAALAMASETDVALVDLNLRDGATGVTIGRILSQTHGVTVLFMTANPSQLGDGVPGAIGVLPKPVSDQELREAVAYAVACHCSTETQPPRRLQLFPRGGSLCPH